MAHSVFSLHVTDLESKSMNKRHVDKFRRRVWLWRVCFGFNLLAITASVAVLGLPAQFDAVSLSSKFVLSTSTSKIPTYLQRESSSLITSHKTHIEDVVSFHSDILILIRVFSSSAFPTKDRLECHFGNDTHGAYRKVTALKLYADRAAVLCGAPPESLEWDGSSVLIEIDSEIEIRRKGKAAPDSQQALQWNSSKVVYEVFPTEEDVVVFVHGINHTRGAHQPDMSQHERLQQFQCVYGDYFETSVTAQSQEIFRCGHPSAHLITTLIGKKLTIRYEGTVLPSVAYYGSKQNMKPADVPLTLEQRTVRSINRKVLAPRADSQTLPNPRKYHICSCTMIYNGAKFLKEWVYYNSHLGVEKFIIYDNGSEDNLDEVIESLSSFNVTKQSWPWMKTQEAGFSHCSLLALPECTWVLFTDIDEYLFPSRRFLSEGNKSIVATPEAAEQPAPTPSSDETQTSNSSILSRFIEESVADHDSETNGTVGQISTFCVNFGPSSLTVSPPQGVTQGYTCRLKKPERHKSIVLLSAIDKTLTNVIHHFTLKPGYGQKLIRPGTAVINHYKYQAWNEFKLKFHRRAATYVPDWTEDRGLTSRDRVPDLGTKAIKPADWETRYCETQDYALRNYTQRVLGFHDSNGKLHLPWE